MSISSKTESFQQIPSDSAALKLLYQTLPGRMLLKVLTRPLISQAAGCFLDSSYSRWLNPIFLRVNQIPLSDYCEDHWPTFNACFSRQIRPEKRPYDMEADHFVSPCDGLLSVYPIEDGLVVPVKMSTYSIHSLLRDPKLAQKYQGGTCLVFRLCVNHYHRYAYVDSGRKTRDRRISGILHTVQPIALRHSPVFTENSRAYTMIRTEDFGDILQMEVGALLVGKISNRNEQACEVVRGQEKGCFLYGGSTIIVLLEKDRVRFPEWFQKSAADDLEIPVRMGEWLGTAAKKQNNDTIQEDSALCCHRT